MSITLEPGTFTAFPHSEAEQQLPPLPDDEMGRVLVKPADPSAVTAPVWSSTTDELSGRAIQMRRADCGAGCRCATEVRFAVTYVTVKIESTYEDGHESSREVVLLSPVVDELEDWWQDTVFPFTGDGHGIENPKLGSCFEATIVKAEHNPELVGKTTEWTD